MAYIVGTQYTRKSLWLAPPPLEIWVAMQQASKQYSSGVITQLACGEMQPMDTIKYVCCVFIFRNLIAKE